MLLFSRVATLQGSPAETMPWAMSMTEIVNRQDGPEVTLWQSLFGAPVGTFSWSALVESRAHLAELTGRLMSDDDYVDALDEVQDFVSPVPTMDYLRRYVAGTPSNGTPEIGSAVEMVTATPKPGRLADAMSFGPEIALKVGTITGNTSSFYLDAYGPFGTMSWLSFHPDLASVDAAQETLLTNDEYLSDVSKGTDLFSTESSMRGLAVRIA